EFVGAVGQERRQVAEAPDPVGIGIGNHIEQHPFDRTTKAYRVRALRIESVVVCLDRIPMIEIGRAASNPSSERCRPTVNKYLGCSPAAKGRSPNPEVGPRSGRV